MGNWEGRKNHKRKSKRDKSYWRARALRAEQRTGKRAKEDFYDSEAWRMLRYQALKRSNKRCELCGATSKLHVDHIKPRSRYPELALRLDNLQVLCRDCNLGKGAWDSTDWREKSIPGT